MSLNPNILYKTLIGQIGFIEWWPIDRKYHKDNWSDPRFEIIVGAILTQNTSWLNVEKALSNLKSKNILDIKNLIKIDLEELKKLIKSSGFFKQKAIRIKNIASYLHENYNDNLDDFFNRKMFTIRQELLSLNGIGKETADSILLYAGSKPIFVVDNYTKRICERLNICKNNSYDKIQEYFENDLSKRYSNDKLTQVYNELHAMIVILAKNYCKKNPNCKKCIMNTFCNYYKNL
jgi:endonuclease-3 related protein